MGLFVGLCLRVQGGRYHLAMDFNLEIPVRFGDCDQAGIVYYPRFLHFCHTTMEELFAQVLGVPYHVAILEEQVGYPTVKVEADYRKPVGFGETIVMHASIARLGNRSVDFLYEGVRTSDGEMAFVIRSRGVSVHMKDWHSVPMPEHHRAGFETILVPAEEA